MDVKLVHKTEEQGAQDPQVGHGGIHLLSFCRLSLQPVVVAGSLRARIRDLLGVGMDRDRVDVMASMLCEVATNGGGGSAHMLLTADTRQMLKGFICWPRMPTPDELSDALQRMLGGSQSATVQ